MPVDVWINSISVFVRHQVSCVQYERKKEQ